MKEYYSLDLRRRILTQYTASADGKSQKATEFIDKKEYDDLAKQLEYVNKKIENRDVMIEVLRQDLEYWIQQAEVYKKLFVEEQKSDKTKALKGTIRGLEKTREKLQAENNRLRKKMNKDYQRFEAELEENK